ncbi:MAG: PQQ-dependent sugar dehydrogenase, partial [Alphaproteobacteria bacterium]
MTAFLPPWQARKRITGFALLAVALLSLAAQGAVAQDRVYRSERAAFQLNTIAGGLEHPWGMAFLPGGDILVTERPGRLRVVRGGKLQRRPVSGVPKVVARGQGGLLDVIAHPRFAENRLIYLSYAARGAGDVGTHVARARLNGGKLTDVRVIFAALPRNSGGVHFGSRMVFGRDGLLYITSGERGMSEDAQKLGTHTGKVIRITDTGAVPPGNPFAGRTGA